MLHILTESNDPYFNMAQEEYVLTKLAEQDDCFLLWQNRQAIIVGRHQNALEEINTAYVRENGIAVVRRLTGGGAVYHDLGNLNFTYVVHDQGRGFDFQRFAQPVISALASLGVKAEQSGRNDILIDGRKFSGNAEYRYRDRLLHHGTLMFDSDLAVVAAALQVKPQKIASKGVKSVRSRVTNIKEHLPPDVTFADFRQALLTATVRQFGRDLQEYRLSDADLAAIRQLQAEKYATWEWTYGQAPEFNLQRSRRYSFGEVDVRLNVREGIIRNCKIFGDFFSHADMEQLAERLVGRRYREEDLVAAIDNLDFAWFFPQLSREAFVEVLLGVE